MCTYKKGLWGTEPVFAFIYLIIHRVFNTGGDLTSPSHSEEPWSCARCLDQLSPGLFLRLRVHFKSVPCGDLVKTGSLHPLSLSCLPLTSLSSVFSSTPEFSLCLPNEEKTGKTPQSFGLFCAGGI